MSPLSKETPILNQRFLFSKVPLPDWLTKWHIKTKETSPPPKNPHNKSPVYPLQAPHCKIEFENPRKTPQTIPPKTEEEEKKKKMQPDVDVKKKNEE